MVVDLQDHICYIQQPFARTNTYLHSSTPSVVAAWNNLKEEQVTVSWLLYDLFPSLYYLFFIIMLISSCLFLIYLFL